MSIPLEKPRDPLVPRPLDLHTPVPLEPDADLAPLDTAKIFAAPDDPADWPAWRAALTRWREEAAARIGYDDAAYAAPEYAWTQSCHVVALAWLWDELLFDHVAGRFTPERFCAESEREFGGFDGIVLWHAYPVIGIDDRNQFDYYRDVPGIRELVAELQERGLRVFVNYNPWDVGTRREPVADDLAIAELVRELGVDGVFLDTMKEAQPGLRAALDGVKAGIALEGESTLPLARTVDHHLSWAQWFADSDVPGVLRARWFEQRHMLHHTRRWNRDHTEELHSAWLNGVGILVWENVFGAWVGWNERDKGLLAGDAPGAAGVRRPAGDGRVDAARRGERGYTCRRLTLERRRDDALDACEPRRGLSRGRSASSRSRSRRWGSLRSSGPTSWWSPAAATRPSPRVRLRGCPRLSFASSPCRTASPPSSRGP